MVYFYLILSGILYGGIVFGGKVLALMGASPFEVMIYPNLLGALLISYFARYEYAKIFRLPAKVNWLMLWSVFFIAVGQYAPLFMNISVTLVLLLIYLQPVWTILIERFYFKKDKSSFELFLAAVMIIGLLFLINPFNGVHFSFSGVSLALLGGVGLSLWIIISQYYSQQKISPAGSYWVTCAFTLPPLFLLYLALKWFGADVTLEMLSLPHSLQWGFILYAVLIYTLPNLLLFAHNKNVPAQVIGMILLLEPVTGISLDVIFLGTELTWNIILGGFIILGANILLVWKQK